jgi:DNA polymerase-3 subunit gamma/tau
VGQDVDVIEIDGASNNGVEQVRELRQNAPLRPSRARFKIYYIDEVHMLSIPAFNALLKTLEEPPGHVKFCFATTEPNKIPITVLSRCQRYDFAGITPEVIAQSLGEICARENVEAEPEALQVVARRGSGSLRDAQSLLDRLLASGSPRLTVEVVHALLGTASDERLLDLIEALARHEPADALLVVDQSAGQGVQPTELLSGLIDFVRDGLVLAVGADSILLSTSPRQRPRLKRIIAGWSVDSILAALQILSECRARMRGSLYGRLLLELALVRVARLENLTDLGSLVERLDALESGAPSRKPEAAFPRRPVERIKDGAARMSLDADTGVPGSPSAEIASSATVVAASPQRAAAPAKSPLAVSATEPQSPPVETIRDQGDSTGHAAVAPAPEPSPETPIPTARDDLLPIDLAKVRNVWPDLVKKVGANLGWRLSQVEPVGVVGSDVLVIAAKPGYNSVGDACGTDEALLRIQQSLQRLIHRPVNLKYERSHENENVAPDVRQPDPRRADAFSSDPLVQKVIELFEARSQQTEYEEEAPSA